MLCKTGSPVSLYIFYILSRSCLAVIIFALGNVPPSSREGVFVIIVIGCFDGELDGLDLEELAELG